MSVVVKYFDVAVGAKQAFNASAEDILPASNIDLLKDEPDEQRYDIPLEINSMILDGASEFLPENSMANIAYISEQMSDNSGNFKTPIVIEFVSDGLFTSIGLVFVFDKIKNIYPTKLNIKWYNDSGLLAQEDFYPTETTLNCNKKVEFYDRIVLTIYSLNVPNSRMRLTNIQYGLKTEFTAKELHSAKIIQEIDPISTSIPINLFDFTVKNNKNIEFTFQAKQPLEVFFNGKKKTNAFIKNAKRKSKDTWDIKSEDYIGLMDGIYFKGGIYVDKNANELLSEIFEVSNVPYNISKDFDNITLTGYIPYTTCREALMQVAFAIGAVVDTSNSDTVNVFTLVQDVSQEITKQRIMQGQTTEIDARVTAVELLSHSYNASNEVLVAYDASQSETGKNIFVMFNEPLYDLIITNGNIIESGYNYAIINANEGCKLSGKKYQHTTVIHRKQNPLVLATDIANVVFINSATLISSSNVDKILDLCYNYIINIEKTNLKIIDGLKNSANSLYGSFLYGTSYYKKGSFTSTKDTSVGDLISYQTEYLGNKQGRIIKQSFALNGGILVKDSIVR